MTEAGLPQEWRAVHDKKGNVYYYNIRTKRTVHDLPPGVPPIISTTSGGDRDELSIQLSTTLAMNVQLSTEVTQLKEEKASLARMLALYQTRLHSARECKMVPSLLATLRSRSDDLRKAIIEAGVDPELVENKMSVCTTADEMCRVLDDVAATLCADNTEALGAIEDFRTYLRSTTECEALRAKVDCVRTTANQTIDALTATLRNALKKLGECGYVEPTE